MQAAYQEVQAFAKYGMASTKSMATLNHGGSSGEAAACGVFILAHVAGRLQPACHTRRHQWQLCSSGLWCSKHQGAS